MLPYLCNIKPGSGNLHEEGYNPLEDEFHVDEITESVLLRYLAWITIVFKSTTAFGRPPH